jgi:hypothetical protein
MHRPLPFTTALLVALLAVAAPAQAAWTWPLQGELITGYLNGDDPYAAGQHRGIDIAGALGAPVVAAAGGEVRFAGVAGSSGLTVSVRTDDGFDTSYLHLGAAHVRAGERVSAGQRLGAVGTSGVRSAAAPHLHFGVREAGSRHAYRDPLAFLPPPPAPAPRAPATAPLPEPVPATPVVAPEPVRVPSPIRRRVPGARRIPVRRPGRAPRRAPVPRQLPVRRPAPQPSPVPLAAPEPGAPRVLTPQPRSAPAGRPAPAPSAHRHRSGEALERPELGPSLQRVPEAARNSDVKAAPSAPSGQPSARAGGPDLGLALACVGVLLAAAILALGGEAGPARRRGGARLAAAIRPLLGRR